jgi:hypothetical protein
MGIGIPITSKSPAPQRRLGVEVPTIRTWLRSQVRPLPDLSFCQNQENYNFRLYVAPVAILWVSLEGLNWVAGKLRHKGLISNPTFREQRHSTFTKAAN